MQIKAVSNNNGLTIPLGGVYICADFPSTLNSHIELQWQRRPTVHLLLN